MEEQQLGVLRSGQGFWLAHNRHLTGTKLGTWCNVTDHDKKRPELVADYRKNKNSDQEPESRGVLLTGKVNQPESVRNYLLLTGRISADKAAEFKLNDILHLTSFWPSDRIVFPGPLPVGGVDDLRDRSPGWEMRNERWRSLLNTYAASPWVSVSPAGTVVAGGLRGALLVTTVLTQVGQTNLGGPKVDRLIHPTINTWIQAILCLVCDSTISFVELAMVNADWIWTWRLERDAAGLEAFKRAIAPAVADWRQMQSAVDDLSSYDENTRRLAEREANKPLLREVADNLRKAVGRYKQENMRVRKVFQDRRGIFFRWAKRDTSGNCVDAVQNLDAVFSHGSQAFEVRRNTPWFWVYNTTSGDHAYVPTKAPNEGELGNLQPRSAFLEMASVI